MKILITLSALMISFLGFTMKGQAQNQLFNFTSETMHVTVYYESFCSPVGIWSGNISPEQAMVLTAPGLIGGATIFASSANAQAVCTGTSVAAVDVPALPNCGISPTHFWGHADCLEGIYEVKIENYGPTNPSGITVTVY